MDSKNRFSNRVEDYHKHRPSYPKDIISILKKENALTETSTVADIGSGTGMLTRLLLEHAKLVFAVEPNSPMRLQAEKDLATESRFRSIDGSAEQTALVSDSIDLITAAQAFHWFDPEKTRTEFKRILRSNGWLALVWNYRDCTADDLQREYEEILRAHIPNYKTLDHKTMTDQKISDFYGTNVRKFSMPNQQFFDLEALQGRVLSSSYVPKPPDPVATTILREVEELYNKYQENGRIRFIYTTTLYLEHMF